MDTIKRWWTGQLIKLLQGSLKVDYKQIDKRAVEEFMYKAFDDRGWRSYFAYEDLKILKELATGKQPWDYAVLVGRRLQLLYIFDEMKKAMENKIAADKKRASMQQGDNTQP